MEGVYDDQAWVYDAAFSWDVTEEVAWLLDRFGPEAKRLLEPGCGSGRLMPAFAEHGVEVVGIDRSPTMLERARRRMAESGLPPPRLEQADMASFDLRERFDGALCPINTFGYLESFEEAASHLACVGAHLRPRTRYLVQLDLRDPDHPGSPAVWEAATPRTRIRCTWSGRGVDKESKIEIQVSRFEILTGPKAGEVYEDLHRMRAWSWSDWSDLVEGSAFKLVAAYAGTGTRWRQLEVGPGLDGLPLTWHELQRT